MDVPELNWTPLLKKESSNVVENFVDQAQAINIVQTVFVGIGLMVLAALLAVLFIWAYQKGGHSLFITVYSGIVFAYVVKVVVLLVIIRDKLTPLEFQLYLGSAAATGLMCLGVLIRFAVSYSQRSQTSNMMPASISSSPYGTS